MSRRPIGPDILTGWNTLEHNGTLFRVFRVPFVVILLNFSPRRSWRTFHLDDPPPHRRPRCNPSNSGKAAASSGSRSRRRYDHAWRERGTDWVVALDCDEFVSGPTGIPMPNVRQGRRDAVEPIGKGAGDGSTTIRDPRWRAIAKFRTGRCGCRRRAIDHRHRCRKSRGSTTQ